MKEKGLLPMVPLKKYETPVIVDLGEVMRGYGACTSGGSPTGQGGGVCSNGNGALGAGKCSVGTNVH